MWLIGALTHLLHTLPAGRKSNCPLLQFSRSLQFILLGLVWRHLFACPTPSIHPSVRSKPCLPPRKDIQLPGSQALQKMYCHRPICTTHMNTKRPAQYLLGIRSFFSLLPTLLKKPTLPPPVSLDVFKSATSRKYVMTRFPSLQFQRGRPTWDPPRMSY